MVALNDVQWVYSFFFQLSATGTVKPSQSSFPLRFWVSKRGSENPWVPKFWIFRDFLVVVSVHEQKKHHVLDAVFLRPQFWLAFFQNLRHYEVLRCPLVLTEISIHLSKAGRTIRTHKKRKLKKGSHECDFKLPEKNGENSECLWHDLSHVGSFSTPSYWG